MKTVKESNIATCEQNYLKISVKDIALLGEYRINTNGYLTIVSHCYHVDAIFVRNIFETLNENGKGDYSILDTTRCRWFHEKECTLSTIETDMPYEIYTEIKDSEEYNIDVKIKVKQKDLCLIGKYNSPIDGFHVSVMDEPYYMDCIFLRSILKCFGPEYKIIDTWDVETDNDDDWSSEVAVQTNLPLSVIKEQAKSNKWNYVELDKNDIRNIGGTLWEHDGNLHIITEHYNECFFLKVILGLFGDEFSFSINEDLSLLVDNTYAMNYLLETNLPYSLYKEIFNSHSQIR